MSVISKYIDFLKKRKGDLKKLNEIDICLSEILEFLKSNNIHNMDDYESCSRFIKNTINSIIDSYSNLEPYEIRFKIALNLSNKKQLLELLKSMEDNEEYEKCSEIIKRINSFT